MSFLILTRFVLVKYSRVFCLPTFSLALRLTTMSLDYIPETINEDVSKIKLKYPVK